MSPSVLGAILLIGVFVVVLVGLPLTVFLIQKRRGERQRVVMRDGRLELRDSAVGAGVDLPVGDIGTVVAFPARELLHIELRLVAASVEKPAGIWTWSGVLVLNRAGRVVRHLGHVPGRGPDPEVLADQIPAPSRITFDRGEGPYSRREFLRRFPRALSFFELRGSRWWALAITGFVVLAIAVVLVIGVVVTALVAPVAR